MKKDGSDGFASSRIGRLATAVIAAIALLGLVTLNPLAAEPDRLDIVELPGVSGAGNNVAYAYGRFILVAPYAPSTPVFAETGPADLDNNYIYSIDTKKPHSEPIAKKLETGPGPDGKTKTVYYPTRLVFDPDRSIAYVRGTRYEETEEGLKEIEVLAYVHLNQDDNGKPVFDTSVVVIDIKGVEQDNCSDAPLDFALGRDSKLVAFTNGAEVFTYNLDHGYIHSTHIVPPVEYGEDSAISYLDIDRSSNTLTVSWNKKIQGEGDNPSYTSEVSFYRLEDDGKLKLLKRVYPEDFPNGGFLTTGSNIAVNSDAETGAPISAFFVSSDGSLCQVDLDSEGIKEAAKSLYVFPELAVESGLPSSPRLVSYDPAKKLVGIVKQGFSVQIKRPTYGRPRRGGVGRDLSTYSAIEDPLLALVKLGKKNKVVAIGVFADEFSGEGGLSNFVSPGEGQVLVATYSGKLFSLATDGEIENAAITKLGEIGSRVERIDYYSNRTSLVAINSLEPDEEGLNIGSPGSLVIAKFNGSAAAGATLLPPFVPTLAAISPQPPSIRRPCNIRK